MELPLWQQQARIAQSVERLTMGGTVQGSNPGGGKIFCTCPERPWGPPSLLYDGYWVFLGGKAAGAWRWPPIPSSTEVEGRVELYICSPSGALWPVIGWTLPLPLPLPSWQYIHYWFVMIDPINSYLCMGRKEMHTEFWLWNLQKRDNQEDHHNIKMKQCWTQLSGVAI